ncbi:MAG: hypothetical protein NW220_02145 [Leptolyngbyaceae cyanobacterium bins.349]|nr:hypothetical protein [Leptolyngbyaceae cyanobacterium bins.349]
MSQKFLAILSMAAIALTATPNALGQTERPTPNGTLKMVMVDQAQLSPNQRTAFQRYLQTANLPPTKVGNRCQFYGKPQVWCLLLDPSVAQQVYQQLKGQPVFGSATEIKEVRRLREPSAKTSGI